MSKQVYTLSTSKGLEQITVEASEEAHGQMQAFFRVIQHMRALASTLNEAEAHVRECQGWVESAIDKSGLSEFSKEDLL